MGPKYRDLPIGMRFRPSDLEMAAYFLMNKALGHHMKARTIPEECHDIFSRHPRDLPDYEREEHWYFYCQKTNNQVTTSSSYNLWKPTGEEIDLLDPKREGELVGIKRSFAFIENDVEEESDYICLSDEEEFPRYNWFMDEISLPSTVVDTDWVMCHIFFKNTKPEFVNVPVIESESESDQTEEEEKEKEEEVESVETMDIVREKDDETVLPPPPASP